MDYENNHSLKQAIKAFLIAFWMVVNTFLMLVLLRFLWRLGPLREIANVLGLGDASIKSLGIFWHSSSGRLKAILFVILLGTSISTYRRFR